MFLSLHAWTMVVGYSKVLAASGNEKKSIFHIDLSNMKKIILQTAKIVLVNKMNLGENITDN